MFNKLSKKQATQLLKQEGFKRKTISLSLCHFNNPDKLRDVLYKAWIELGVLVNIFTKKE